MKKKEYRITNTVILVVCGDDFAILNRRPSDNGIFGITFSFPVKSWMVKDIENSGIASVESFNDDGLLTFSRKPFFETYLMIDVLTSIIEKYETLR
jgi:hypothetical protein